MNVKHITPLFGIVINNTSFDEMISIQKKWQELLYRNNVIIVENINLSEEKFVKFSHYLGTPWNQEQYRLHGEIMEDNEIVNWNDRSGLYKKALCWHKDNSWSPKWRHPIRMLYSIQIPDKNSGVLHYLDLRYIFNNLLSKKEQNWLSDHHVLIQNYKNKSQKFLYPLVQINPITGHKSLFITAMDIDSNVFGLKKDRLYKKGHTFLLKIIHKSGKELSLNYLVEYIQATMKIKECFFYYKWKPSMIQIISNLDTVHMRTKISNHTKMRVLWRKTIAHDFQTL